MKFYSFEIDDLVESIDICILLTRAVSSRKYVVSVVLEREDGTHPEVERWPTYGRLGHPGKFVRLAEAGDLVRMPAVRNSIGSGTLKVAVSDKKGADVNLGEVVSLMRLKDPDVPFLVRSQRG